MKNRLQISARADKGKADKKHADKERSDWPKIP